MLFREPLTIKVKTPAPLLWGGACLFDSMLLLIQYTITDFRRLINHNCGILPFPDWPFPEETEFMKSMGQIRNRKSGGLNNWVGESIICIAKKCIKIDKWYTFSKKAPYEIKLRFRRFYFDGIASGKYEFGFQINHRDNSDKEYINLKNVIEDLFSLKVRIPLSKTKEYSALLGNAMKCLSTQYLLSSTKNKVLTENKIDDLLDQIKCSTPSIFIEKKSNEKTLLNLMGNTVNINDKELTVSHYNLQLQKKAIERIETCSMWILCNNKYDCNISNIDEPYNKYVRDIRVFLSRLNSIRISLNNILSAISQEKIAPIPNSIESNLLQKFILSSVKNVIKREIVIEDELLIMIRDIENRITPGLNSTLYQKLEKSICIRPQVLNRIKAFIEHKDFFNELNGNLFKGDFIMNKIEGDKITIGNVTNSNLNFSKGDIYQDIYESFNHIEEIDSKKLIDLLSQVELQIKDLVNKISNEDFTDIENDFNSLKNEANKKSPRGERIKTFFKNFVDSVKRIGDVGLPIVKLISETIALF